MTAPVVEPPAEDMFIEQTAHASAEIDAAIAELASARNGAELAPASEPDLPPELALGITGTKFEFVDLKQPEDESYELSSPELSLDQTPPWPATPAAPEPPPVAAAPAPPPAPAPAAAPTATPESLAQSLEESFADLMDGAGDPEPPPLAGFATPPRDAADSPAFDSPSLVSTPRWR